MLHLPSTNQCSNPHCLYCVATRTRLLLGLCHFGPRLVAPRAKLVLLELVLPNNRAIWSADSKRLLYFRIGVSVWSWRFQCCSAVGKTVVMATDVDRHQTSHPSREPRLTGPRFEVSHLHLKDYRAYTEHAAVGDRRKFRVRRMLPLTMMLRLICCAQPCRNLGQLFTLIVVR